MIIRAIAIMAAAFLLTGCGKKTEAPPAAQPTAQPQAQPAPAPVVQQPAAPAPVVTSQTRTNAAVAPDLNAMSNAVRLWIAAYGHFPKNFEEWAATPNYAYPPPPPGKKYAFDRKMRVVLVDR